MTLFIVLGRSSAPRAAQGLLGTYVDVREGTVLHLHFCVQESNPEPFFFVFSQCCS